MKRTFAKLLSLFVVLTLVIAMLPAVFAAARQSQLENNAGGRRGYDDQRH